AVDPWFIVDAAPEQAKLIHTARQVNDYKPGYVIDKIREKADKFKNPIIACLGLAFKANIDDLRESPSVEIVEHLANQQLGEIIVSEPNIQQLPEKLSKLGIKLDSTVSTILKADIIVLLVDHDA
nr:UDP-N-acetyl-D-mannosamine dehydrogenase [Bacillus pacificus]